MSAHASLFSGLRVRCGAWRNGRRWKVYLYVGDWFIFELGLGAFWLWLWRFSIQANRAVVRWEGERQTNKRAQLTIEWRYGRV